MKQKNAKIFLPWHLIIDSAFDLVIVASCKFYKLKMWGKSQKLMAKCANKKYSLGNRSNLQN